MWGKKLKNGQEVSSLSRAVRRSVTQQKKETENVYETQHEDSIRS